MKRRYNKTRKAKTHPLHGIPHKHVHNVCRIPIDQVPKVLQAVELTGEELLKFYPRDEKAILAAERRKADVEKLRRSLEVQHA